PAIAQLNVSLHCRNLLKKTVFILNIEIMKNLVKKKIEVKKVSTKKVAQCCAKTSKTIVGCHD
ncbi:MAG: hypothetical protein NTW16_06235, partial [Bacteroidetes bacterium]|nr:hypothetical protein [Bacteroidota bacterium]